MSIKLPSTKEVRTYLRTLSHAQVQALSATSEVPFNTLWNIRKGLTGNPGIETVGKFYPPVAEAKKPKRRATEQQGA